MTPDQIQECAQRAYEIMAANTGETAAWGSIANKESWYALVRAHEQHPEAIQRIEPNMQERCVAQAYREMYAPAAKQPLVIPADEKKAKKGEK